MGQKRLLCHGLDTLRNNLELKRVAECNDDRDDRGILGTVWKIADEAIIDLEFARQ